MHDVPPSPELYFEDFPVGAEGICPPRTVTREDIVAYASEFDPQPFHLDEGAAKDTFVGELIASGWQTCALSMRILYEGMIHRSSSMGSPAVDEVKWLKPVRPGDSLEARWTVLDTRVSRSRPEMGFLRTRLVLVNQKDEAVYEQNFQWMAGRRGFAWDMSPAQPPAPDAHASPALPDMPAEPANAGYFEDLAVGETHPLGSYHFTPESIIRFAKAYDPQPFHVDAEAAKRSHFGALCASGWHTGGACMRKLIDRRRAANEALAARGIKPAAMGSSPGFKDLKWLKPVYAGDTVSFTTTVVAKRPSVSRPRWGLAFSRNVGVNQRGETVYEFTGSVFIERRPA